MNDSAVKRTLAAIMIADVVAYSRMMGEDEAGTVRAITRLRSSLMDPIVASHRGRIVNAVGDSLLAEFGSVVDATHCAIALQQGLADRNAPLPENRRVQLRIGVNIGEVIVQDRAVFGDSVNIAARLQTLAEPGGVCISAAAHDQVRGKIEAEFADAGAREVKNIARPIGVFALSANAIDAMVRRPAPASRMGWKRYGAATLAGVLVVALVGAAWFWRSRAVRADFVARLDALLASSQAKTSEKSRGRLIRDYLAYTSYRVMVIAPKARSHWWTGDWPTAAIARDKALERCQMSFAEPCIWIASEEALVASEQASEPHDMAKVGYAGEFDPQQLPGVRANVISRADVAGYRAAAEPKAAAIHARGVIAIATGAASQVEANAKALKACNENDATLDADGPCYLYAEGNKVVLAARRAKATAKP